MKSLVKTNEKQTAMLEDIYTSFHMAQGAGKTLLWVGRFARVFMVGGVMALLQAWWARIVEWGLKMKGFFF